MLSAQGYTDIVRSSQPTEHLLTHSAFLLFVSKVLASNGRLWGRALAAFCNAKTSEGDGN